MKRSALLILILSLSAVWAFAGGTHENSSATSGRSMSHTTTQPATNTMSPSVTMHFTSLKEAEMYASSGPTLLYFCSTGDSACRSTVAKLDSGMAKLPTNAHVFVVDYSKASGLRMRYNVNMDDTFVKISPSGGAEMMWSGGGTEGLRMRLAGK